MRRLYALMLMSGLAGGRASADEVAAVPIPPDFDSALTEQVLPAERNGNIVVELTTLVKSPSRLALLSFGLPPDFEFITYSVTEACPPEPGSDCRQMWRWTFKPGPHCRLDGDYLARFGTVCPSGYSCSVMMHDVPLRLTSEDFCHAKGGPALELYENAGYAGRTIEIREDCPDLSKSLPAFDDIASSLKLVNGAARAALYSGPDFQGTCQTVTKSIRDLAGSIVGNDAVSSIRFNRACP